MEWKVGREREKETERERGGVAERVLSVGHKLDHWSSIHEGYRENDNPRVYQDGNKGYPKKF